MENLNDIYYEVLNQKSEQVCISGVSGQEELIAKLLAEKLKYKFVETLKNKNEKRIIFVENTFDFLWNSDFNKFIDLTKKKDLMVEIENNKRLVLFILPEEFSECDSYKKLFEVYSTLWRLNKNLIIAYDSFFDVKSFKKNISFDEKAHKYYKNGITFVSTTNLIHHFIGREIDFLSLDKENFGNLKENFKHASIRGLSLHRSIEGYFLTNRDFKKPHEDYFDYWNQFEKWDLKFKPEILEIEFKFIHEKLRYSGTIDCICKINNVYWILDWKTQSKATFEKWIYQLHFYALALKDEPEYKNKNFKLGIVHFNKNTLVFYEFENNPETLKIITEFLKWRIKKDIHLNKNKSFKHKFLV